MGTESIEWTSQRFHPLIKRTVFGKAAVHRNGPDEEDLICPSLTSLSLDPALALSLSLSATI
jgi:hypothetical protein